MRCDELSDDQLLAAFTGGDQEAFEGLVRRHGRMVLSVSKRFLSDTHAAEDAAQAVFLALAHKASSLQGYKSVANWLHTVAWRIAVRSSKLQRRREEREWKAATMATQSAPNDELNDLSVHLDRELHALPEKYLTPLLLHYFEGYTEEEGARLLGLARGTFSSRICRARELLRSRLSRRGAAVPAAIVAGLLVAKASAAGELPAGFVTGTAKAASSIAKGNLAGSGVSAHTYHLSQEALKGLFALQIQKWVALGVAAVLAIVALCIFQPSIHPSAATLVSASKTAAAVPTELEMKLARVIDVDFRQALPDEVLSQLQERLDIDVVWPDALEAERGFSFAANGIPARVLLEKYCAENGFVLDVRARAVLVWAKLEDSKLHLLEEQARQGTPVDRADALLELAQSGDLRAMPCLIDALNDSDKIVQSWAVNSLLRNCGGMLGYCEHSELAADSLLRLVQNTPPALDYGEVMALLVQTRSANALQKSLERWPESVHDRLKLALALECRAHPNAGNYLEKLLSDPNAQVRAAAATVFAEDSGPDAQAGALLEALRDPNAAVRAPAATALGRCQSDAVSEALRASLADSSRAVRVEAIRSLGRLKNRDSAAALQALLNENSWDIRVAAANALAEINDYNDLSALMSLIVNRNYDYSFNCSHFELDGGAEGMQWMWRKTPDRQLARISPLLQIHAPLGRQRLANAIAAVLAAQDDAAVDSYFIANSGCVRDERVNERLVSLVSSPREEIHDAAISALFESRDPRAFSMAFRDLEVALANKKPGHLVVPPARGGITGAFKREMLAACNSSVRMKRTCALSYLAGARGPEVKKALLDAAGEPDEMFSTVVSLGLLGSPGGTTEALKILSDNSRFAQIAENLAIARDPRAQETALNGLQSADPAERMRWASAVNGAENSRIGASLMQLAATGDDKALRETALRALGSDRLDREARAAVLTEALNSSDKDIQRAAADTLSWGGGQPPETQGDTNIESQVPVDVKPEMRNAVVRKKIGDRQIDPENHHQWCVITRMEPRGIGAALSLDQFLSNPNPLARRAAINALIRQDAECDIGQARALLTDSDPFVRIGALGMLAGERSARETALVEASLGDADKNVRNCAAEILIEISDRESTAVIDRARAQRILDETKPQNDPAVPAEPVKPPKNEAF